MTTAGKLTQLLAGFMFLGLGLVHAAGIQLSPDVEQAFNFHGDTPKSFGYVSSLTIGGRPLAADIRIRRPDGTGANVVGVLSSASWSGGFADPVALNAQVSTANRQVIAPLIQAQLRDNSVTFQFQVFAYDALAKKWYQAFGGTSGAALAGVVQKEGQHVKLVLAPQPGDAVRSPQNWGVSLGIAPAPRSQALLVATSSAAAPIAKRWGIEVPK